MPSAKRETEANAAAVRLLDEYVKSCKGVDADLDAEPAKMILKSSPQLRATIAAHAVSRMAKTPDRIAPAQQPLIPLLHKMIRASLTFSEGEILQTAQDTARMERVAAFSLWHLPKLVAAWESFAREHGCSKPLGAAFATLNEKLRREGRADERKLAERLEAVLQSTARAAAAKSSSTTAGKSKRASEPAQGPADADRIAKQAAGLVGKFLKNAPERCYRFEELADCAEAKAIMDADRETQAAVVLDLVDRIAAVAAKIRSKSDNPLHLMNLRHAKTFPSSALPILERLLRRRLPFTPTQLLHLAKQTASIGYLSLFSLPYLTGLVSHWETFVAESGFPDGLRESLAAAEKGLRMGGRSDERRLADRLAALDEQNSSRDALAPGEAWSDKALSDLAGMPAAKRSAWNALLLHCKDSTGGKPAAKWIKAADALIEKISWKELKPALLAWLPLVDQARTAHVAQWSQWQPNPNLLLIEPHSEILKGLAWACGAREDAEIARALGALAVSAYKKIPMQGPRAVKVGNACVHALGAMPGTAGVAHLAILKAKVKFGTAQKGIEKALAAAAERAGVAPDEIEELAAPTFGFQEPGLRREKLGEFAAELAVVGASSIELRWFRADGKPQKSLPAAVKESHAEALRELKGAAKDAEKFLSALRDRLDSIYLERRSWPYAAWRERYLDHPLCGALSRRLIWEYEAGDARGACAWLDGRLVGADDAESPREIEKATIRLWHPIGKPLGEILAWREWLERHAVRQPFKQAHREIYLLTDAERRTETYSNRYAAHILRQHQFNALCAARGWKNQLRLLVDQDFLPARRILARWDIRAEFWIEGAGDDFGVDTNETGTFLRVATDQVRFYPINSPDHPGHAAGGGFRLADAIRPIALGQIPPLVFSEVMRDVDLFVGVGSVGNDPTWADGGPQGRYREYWQGYAFGDLSGTAQTRKETLEKLVPRLRIAARCSFEERFLVVRGDLRTYRIHLGSGNILMEPDNQYLCIVKAPARDDAGRDGLFLPFEGDGTLSVILSKAFMLANDSKIDDPTIVRQIKLR